MSKDLVKLNWDLVKQADSNASKHNEVQQKVANIGEYLQDPDIQNALLAGGAGALGGGVMGAFGEKDDDESRAWKILKNVLGYGGAAALMGYGAGPASRALGGPDDPLGGVKDWGKEQYDNFVDKTPKVNHQGPEAGVPPLLDPNTSPAQVEPFNPANLVPEGIRPISPTPTPMPQGQGPLRPELLPPPKTGSATDLVKRAGYWSELAGGLNPLNYYGGSLIGQGAALATPTRNMREQAEADEDMWKNLLVPGVAGYNSAKRLGHAIRGPELKGIKARQEAEAEHTKAHAEDEQHREEDEKSKEAGFWTEQAAMLNPLNYPALPFAAGAAAMTDTRSLDEQAEADKSTWSNFLVPGKGSYNAYKRLGTSIRGPEIEKERADLAGERKEQEGKKREKALSRGRKKDDKDDKKDEEKEALFMGAGIGALIGTMKAREGEKLRGAGYGAGIGAGTSLGVGLGSSAGMLAGGALGSLGGPAGSLVGAGIGGLLGGGGGGALGYTAGQGIAKDVGESSGKGMPWGPAPDEEEDEAKAEEKEGAAIGAYFAKISVDAAKWKDKSRKKKRSKVRIDSSGKAHISKKKKVKSAAEKEQATPPARRKVTPPPARPKTPTGTTRSA